MSKKKISRLRRAKKARMHIRELEVPRLSVFRTPRHIYAQIISAAGDIVQASASSLDASVREENKGNSDLFCVSYKQSQILHHI